MDPKIASVEKRGAPCKIYVLFLALMQKGNKRSFRLALAVSRPGRSVNGDSRWQINEQVMSLIKTPANHLRRAGVCLSGVD